MSIIFYTALAIFVFISIKNMIPAKGIRHISTDDLKQELKAGNKQFIDVRTPSEYKGHHVKGFQNIPLQQLASRVNELDRNKEVVVMCQSGMRSQKAAQLLKKKGFTNVTNVQDGICSWKQ
ncbi:rhodanese-like domain-containing protein [Bacillus sp. REN10]|uniref:rhodanese-like domain-containing protein n=1 Tax=Bacillus sp. REN10 TaxID=2782541 RepID=UPI00193C81CD|nr:rhodanese-like domain-containing protein [Bacillus sp. REN10]